ncbi:MAG: cytochrome c [Rhodocyclaceae bacterium]|nr:cytochrome c [Rhodocyclaceae bacterium]
MKQIFLMIAALLPAMALASEDTRQFVKMSPEARAELRIEMLDFQTSLHLIIGALSEQKFAEAADIAEKQMGISAMGRHRTAPANARPGMFMPNEMHAIARGMHVSASDFAKTAKGGDTAKALTTLQAVTGACVTCHRSYRTQ